MATIDYYIRVLEDFIIAFPKKIDEIVLRNESYFVEAIQDRLYDKGEDGDGDSLGDYSLFYADYKKSIGAISDHITLFNTGSFYSGMFVSSNNGQLRIYSRDSKTRDILDMFTGFDIFGFTKQEQDFLYEEILKPDIDALFDTLPKDIEIDVL